VESIKKTRSTLVPSIRLIGAYLILRWASDLTTFVDGPGLISISSGEGKTSIKVSRSSSPVLSDKDWITAMTVPSHIDVSTFPP
jgi:hypothetical protein